MDALSGNVLLKKGVLLRLTLSSRRNNSLGTATPRLTPLLTSLDPSRMHSAQYVLIQRHTYISKHYIINM